MRHFSRALIVLALLVAAAAPAWAADETYAIKLSRPDKAGDLYDIDATIDSTHTTTFTLPQRDPIVQNESTKGRIQARVEYLEVDKKGDPVSLVLTVKKLVDGDGKELLPAGQEVRIKRDAQSATMTLADGTPLPGTTLANGKPKPGPAEQLLFQIYGSHSSDAPSDDESFGSADKHKVGDSWPIHAEDTAKAFASSGTVIDPKQISGTTTLKSLETLNGVPTLRVVCQVVVKDATPASPDPSMKVESLNLQVEFSGAFPVDPALQPLESGEKVTMETHMTGTPPGAPGPVNATIKGQSTKSVKYAPVKK